MKRIIPILVFISFISVGCAGRKSPSMEAQLQIKVNQLEKKLELREQEIEELKYQVSNISSQMDDSNNFSLNDQIEDIDVSSRKTLSATSVMNEDIIRVSASPEQVQQALKAAGYYNGNIDGKIGKGSREAIVKFQKDHNLTADGVIGKKTWNELKSFLE